MNTLHREAQRRLMTVTAHLTASEGPLRLALNELGRLGIGERIIKSAVAATIAWLVAGQIPRESAPFVAALTAMYTIDLTIVKSLLQAGQRLAGIALGIGVAFLAAELIGVHSWSVGLVILIALMIGLRLNLRPEGMVQVASTAIVVMVVRATTEERGIYSLNFLADTAIGTAVGLTVNGLIAPPNFLPKTRLTINLLITRLAVLVDQLATMIADGISPAEAQLLATTVDQVQIDLTTLDESLGNARESLRFNLMASQQRNRLDHFHSIDLRLEPVVSSVQQLLSSLSLASEEAWMTNTRLTGVIASLIRTSAVILHQQGPGESDSRADPGSIAAVQERIGELTAIADQILPHLDGRSWTRMGHVVESAINLANSMVGLNR